MIAAQRRPARGERLLLAPLALWGLGPLALMILHSLRAGVSLTGADGPIAPDVLQYLAWVRDAGSHGLAANLFDLRPAHHVWLHPMFSLSGLAVALGAGAIGAYLAWTPVAIVALFAAASVWARELLQPGRGRVAAVALALFLINPLRALIDANAAGIGVFKLQLVQVTSEPFAAGLLWGYLPSVIATALMPACLIACARALSGGAAERRRPAAAPLIVASVCALLAAWLHPWQGVTLVVLLGCCAVWARRRRELWLAAPVAAGAAPLIYYAALAHYDAAWHSSQAVTAAFPRFSAGVLALGLAPLLLAAAPGLARRAPESLLERALALWVPVAILAYLVVPFPSHALEGISFPLAVLLVRGWARLAPARRGPAAVAGTALVLVATLPGMLAEIHDFRGVVRRQAGSFYLQPGERRALHYVAAQAPAGGVVAPLPLAEALPAATGRAVWAGHAYWSPGFYARALAVQAMFAGSAGALRRVLEAAHPRLLVASCATRADLAPQLGAALLSRMRFGCATVYVLRGDGLVAGARRLRPA